MVLEQVVLIFYYTNGADTKKDPLNIKSLVIDLNLLIVPDLKYSKDKTKIEIIKRVNNEKFWRVPFFKKADRIAIIKSSLPESAAIVF